LDNSIEATVMATNKPIIVVTGGNRGIGFEVCRQLAQRGAQVILTARQAEASQEAVKTLAAQKLDVRFHALDVTDPASAAALRDYLQRTFGRLDVLINNAGIYPNADGSGLEVPLQIVRTTLETNTLAPLYLSQLLVPLLNVSSAARIINVSSGLGALSSIGGDHAAYRISKAALNAVSGILAAELQGAVAVNAACPGWVRTDMGGPNADRDVGEGAAGIVWLALDAPQDLTGKFVRDGKVIPW
jgi:NAD(P)-dependent dehydrogenase (short-subunit alcohol dehydrogenase family)